jgi:hypothetical protein
MLTIKDIQVYFDKFGEDLINDITQKIQDENWVKSGRLINSLDFSSQIETNKIIAQITIEDYYQYLRSGGGSSVSTPRLNSGTRTRRVNGATQGLQTTGSNPITWVTPIIETKIKQLEDFLTKELELKLQEKLNKDYK